MKMVNMLQAGEADGDLGGFKIMELYEAEYMQQKGKWRDEGIDVRLDSIF